MVRSAFAFATVVVVVALFGVVGSKVVVVAVAVFDRTVPAAVFAATVTTIVTVALAPTARLPSGQLTVVVPVHGPPWLGVAETRVVAAGRVSLTLTPAAVVPVDAVLLLVTVSV
jgi:hypothetical protein